MNTHCLQCGLSLIGKPNRNIRKFCGNQCVIAHERTKGPARFWAKVNKGPHPTGCWVWTGYRQKFGYGWLCRGHSAGVLAHRYSWQLLVGTIPKDKFILHHCDNPPCVNPAHLYVGSFQENASDMAARGRSTKGERSWRAKLTEAQVTEILRHPPAIGNRWKASELQQRAKLYGVHPTTNTGDFGAS